MRVVIITQNDPFYVAVSIDQLLRQLPDHSQVVGCVVANASPFGKKESFVGKMSRTLNVFGLSFFVYYGFKFILSKLNRNKNVFHVLKTHNIPNIEIQGNINSPESLDLISSYNPDLLVSILGNQIFKRKLLDLAPRGCINLHTALLPKYRGLMPTFWVMRFNEKETGVSVFLVDEGIDSGPIIMQERVQIGSKSQQQLIKETKSIGMRLIAQTIDLMENKNVNYIPNPNEEQTYFSFPTKDDVKEFKRIGKRFF